MKKLLAIALLLGGSMVMTPYMKAQQVNDQVQDKQTFLETIQTKWHDIQPQLGKIKTTFQEKFLELQPQLQKQISELKEKAQESLAAAKEKFNSLSKETQAKLKKQADDYIAALKDLKNKIFTHKKEGTLTEENYKALVQKAAPILAALAAMAVIIGIVYSQQKVEETQEDTQEVHDELYMHPEKGIFFGKPAGKLPTYQEVLEKTKLVEKEFNSLLAKLNQVLRKKGFPQKQIANVIKGKEQAFLNASLENKEKMVSDLRKQLSAYQIGLSDKERLDVMESGLKQTLRKVGLSEEKINQIFGESTQKQREELAKKIGEGLGEFSDILSEWEQEIEKE